MPRGAVRPTVASHWVVLVANSLEANGFRALAWLHANGYSKARLQSDLGVPWDVPVRLWRAAVRATRDSALGVHAAEKVPDSAPDMFLPMLISSATLRDALELIVRYQDILASAHVAVFEPRGEHWALGILGAGDPPLTSQQIAFNLALWCRVCRFIAGVDFRPVAVHLEQAAPRDATEYLRVFGCPVFFLQSSNVLLLTLEMMQRRSTFGNARTLATLRKEADRRLAEIAGPAWTDRVRSALAARLPKGGATLAGVARQLGVATRTLQRHLTDEGVGFQDLLDDARQVRAKELLASAGVTATEVSRQLGFADARSFHRAFRRWTSLTPAEYRRRSARGTAKNVGSKRR